MVGKTLSHYQILARLGAGGMGDVYRARDTKLERDVAVKVLPDELAGDPDRLARFEREARLLASLNHPNIGTLHGLETSDGIHFLVLELIEGETLARRLREGAMPVREALDIARQACAALKAAHGNGIIHRDVKPSNVQLTAEGGVKVLDFGIARRTELPTEGSVTQQATHLTVEGTLLGTPPYMSPEQIRGRQADERTDIWAFGCVLYEMLTGKAAFARETTGDTLAAVLEVEPDWDALPREAGPLVERLLRRCLSKDPRRRLHDIADARIEIEDALEAPDSTAAKAMRFAPSSADPGRSLNRTLLLLAAVAIVVAIVVSVSAWSSDRRSGPGIGPIRFTETLPEGRKLSINLLAGRSQRPLDVSPDGAVLVYAATEQGVSQIYWRPLDAREAEPIPGTGGGFSPFFSPDGNAVGFFRDGSLWRVDVVGGVPDLPTRFGDVGNWPEGAAWLADDRVYLHHWNPQARLDLVGGASASRVRNRDLDVRVIWPAPLPGSGYLLGTQAGAVVAVDLESGDGVRLTTGVGGRFAPPGYLVYAHESRIRVVAFDPGRRETTGEPVPIEQYVRTDAGVAQFAVSESTLAYVPGPSAEISRVVWANIEGGIEPLPLDLDEYQSLDLSHDGERLAVAIADRLWVFDVNSGRGSPLVDGHGRFPKWSPDGRWVAFTRVEGGVSTIYRVRTDGSGVLEELAVGSGAHPQSWSSDGRLLIYGAIDPRLGTNDLWVLDVEAGGGPEPFAQTPAGETQPAFALEGNLITYVSSEGGRDEVYVQAYPSGDRDPISTNGGYEPLWCGEDIIYREAAGRWMVARAVSDGEFGTPELFVEGSFRNFAEYNYDVAPACDRIVALAFEPATEINVVFGWAEGLR